MSTRHHVLSFRVRKDPPREFAAIAADCFHNLRQALDHIAYRLAIVISGSDPPPREGNIYFPIASTPEEFEGKLSSSFGSRSGIPPDIRTIFEDAQPYRRQMGDDFLPVLENLDNYDKHRVAPVIAVGGLAPEINIGTLATSYLDGPHLGPVKHGTEIMRFVPLDLDGPVEMHLPTTAHIAFAEGDPGWGLAVLPFLNYMRDFIRFQVVRPLDTYL